jgi:ribosome maturation factor RimP
MAIDEAHVRRVMERVAASSDLELVEIEFRGGGKSRMLRAFIDKPGCVTHEDCANFSREVGTILDVEDAVPGGPYTLEVSSPGLDRKLVRPVDYERSIGKLVKLTTREPIEGNRHLEGRLQNYQAGRIRLELKPARKKHKPPDASAPTIEIDLFNVEKANLVPEF